MSDTVLGTCNISSKSHNSLRGKKFYYRYLTDEETKAYGIRQRKQDSLADGSCH